VKNQEKELRVLKINEKIKLKVNLRNLNFLIRELMEMKNSKVSAIKKTKGIDSKTATDLFINLLKDSPSEKERALTRRESLSEYIAKHVIVNWKGLKTNNQNKEHQKTQVFYSLLLRNPKILKKILNIGISEYYEKLKP
ncbi:hypothetical protein, partial [Marinobacter sp. EhN04]|uniref:hypothetical protein n=2 Tax=Marinobacteraceae TaxID=2887365 RepID=UPI001372DBAD